MFRLLIVGYIYVYAYVFITAFNALQADGLGRVHKQQMLEMYRQT